MAEGSQSAWLAAVQALREKHAQPKAHRVFVANGTCCREQGSEKVLADLGKLFEGTKIRLSQSGCTGAHFAHPTIQVQMADGRRAIFSGKGMPLKGFAEELRAGKMPLANRHAVFTTTGRVDEAQPFFAPQVRTTLKDAGFCDPTSLGDYVAVGGFEGLARALELGADGVLDLLKKATVRGRGGVGFPMG